MSPKKHYQCSPYSKYSLLGCGGNGINLYILVFLMARGMMSHLYDQVVVSGRSRGWESGERFSLQQGTMTQRFTRRTSDKSLSCWMNLHIWTSDSQFYLYLTDITPTWILLVSGWAPEEQIQRYALHHKPLHAVWQTVNKYWNIFPQKRTEFL